MSLLDLARPALSAMATPTVVPQLRPYQQSAIETIKRLIREGVRRILVVAPTGAGKTILFARIVAGSVAKESPCLILAHRGELLEQTWDKVCSAGVPREQLGMVWADDRRANARALCQIASVQTLVRRRRPPAKVVVIDESHRAMGQSYRDIVADYPDAVLLGFTATPWRLDGQGLGQLYERVVVVATVPELIEQGFLCKPRVYSHPMKPDLSGVKLRGGDYDERALAKAVDTKIILGSIVEHWQLHAQGARTIAFAVTVEHSKNIAAEFRAAGVAAEHVDGETPANERAAILKRLASGETRVVSNCALFVEGFDCPSVKCVILARPTKSKALYMQAVGRGMRPDPEFPELRTCLVLDHAACALEHGLPQDPQDYSLDQGKRSRRAGSEAPVKACEQCYAINPTAALVCEACGAPFPIKKTTLKESDGQLKEIEESEARAKALEEARIKKLRGKIQSLAITSDETRSWQPGETNRLLCNRFGSRREMNAQRLQVVLEYLQYDFAKAYPIAAPTSQVDSSLSKALASTLAQTPSVDFAEAIEEMVL